MHTEEKMDAKKPSLFCRLQAAFTEHPRLAGETYLQHLFFTQKMAWKLVFSGLALVIHGIFPFVCTHTASKTIRDCHGTLDDRSCKTGGKS